MSKQKSEPAQTLITGIDDEPVEKIVSPSPKKSKPKAAPATEARDLAVVESNTDRMLRIAVEKGLPIETLERLIDVRNREEDRARALEFHLHFAEMQKEFKAVEKTEYAKDAKGNRLYAFAPLGTILEVYQPVITKHGFSFSFSQEAIEGPVGEKRHWMTISGYGHQERSYMDLPVMQATSFTNALQQRGVSATYGYRYVFCAGFGVILKDEDNDATTFTSDQVMLYAEPLKLISESQTIKDLAGNFKMLYDQLAGDDSGRELVIYAKDKRKAELKAVQNAGA